LNEEMDAELSKIEEALYAYGQREELEAIFGSDHVAKIKIERKEKYPFKGDPNRKMLDEMIKKAGKWMEVSDLNLGCWPGLSIEEVGPLLSSKR